MLPDDTLLENVFSETDGNSCTIVASANSSSSPGVESLTSTCSLQNTMQFSGNTAASNPPIVNIDDTCDEEVLEWSSLVAFHSICQSC